MLDPYRVPQIEGRLTVAPDFPLRGSCKPQRVVDADGREWVRKIQSDGLGVGLAGEVVGALLGRALGVPIPSFGVASVPRAWLSEFKDHGAPWSDMRANDVENEEELGRILALDAIILNGDRRAENLLLTIGDSDEWRVWAIDHGAALVSAPDEFNIRRDLILSTGALPRGIPLRRLRDGAMECAVMAASLGATPVSMICAQACALSQNTMETTMAEVLSYRCRNAARFVERYLDALENR